MLKPGIITSQSKTVTAGSCADAVGSGSVHVFATPAMVALMESCCATSVQPYLEQGQTTVGVRIDINHSAPTPEGMTVECRSTLVSVSGRTLSFRVEVYDASGMIGEGTHDRCIVDQRRFQTRADDKHKV